MLKELLPIALALTKKQQQEEIRRSERLANIAITKAMLGPTANVTRAKSRQKNSTTNRQQQIREATAFKKKWQTDAQAKAKETKSKLEKLEQIKADRQQQQQIKDEQKQQMKEKQTAARELRQANKDAELKAQAEAEEQAEAEARAEAEAEEA